MVRVTLHYRRDGAGEPVVLLHGLGGSGADWQGQFEALSAHHDVIAPDFRGHGASPGPPGAWRMTDFAADVVELLRSVGATPAHVVGLSLGGMVAFQMAVDAPEMVRSLVIVNSGPAFPGRSWRGRLLIWSRLAMIRWRGMEPMGRTIAQRLFPAAEQAELAHAFVSHFVTNSPDHYANTLRAIQHFDVADRLGKVRCPVLAISGDRDYTPLAAKEAWVRHLPAARLEVITDSGHATPVDQPAAFLRALEQFLADAG